MRESMATKKVRDALDACSQLSLRYLGWVLGLGCVPGRPAPPRMRTGTVRATSELDEQRPLLAGAVDTLDEDAFDVGGARRAGGKH